MSTVRTRNLISDLSIVWVRAIYLSCLINILLTNLGSASGMKNSAAVLSGMPISHSVGPSLGGSNTSWRSLISCPAFFD